MLSRIHTILFDLDGTLTVPVIDFDGLRRRLSLPAGVSIVHALEDMDAPTRERAYEVVHEVELEAAGNATPAPGAVDLIRWLDVEGYATGIITRNNREAVDITLRALDVQFDVIITRECAPPKPAPDAVHEALRRLRRKPGDTLMVGDYQDDMLAGKNAGTMTCLVTNGESPSFEADIHVPWLSDLHKLLRKHK
ncbi:MAG: HAD family hydrolase [Planctomycetes bacterium]|nr:HAD family hydrolase [Planctomycetota bacterium]